jgi:hypothetical protein
MQEEGFWRNVFLEENVIPAFFNDKDSVLDH